MLWFWLRKCLNIFSSDRYQPNGCHGTGEDKSSMFSCFLPSSSSGWPAEHSAFSPLRRLDAATFFNFKYQFLTVSVHRNLAWVGIHERAWRHLKKTFPKASSAMGTELSFFWNQIHLASVLHRVEASAEGPSSRGISIHVAAVPGRFDLNSKLANTCHSFLPLALGSIFILGTWCHDAWKASAAELSQRRRVCFQEIALSS